MRLLYSAVLFAASLQSFVQCLRLQSTFCRNHPQDAACAGHTQAPSTSTPITTPSTLDQSTQRQTLAKDQTSYPVYDFKDPNEEDIVNDPGLDVSESDLQKPVKSPDTPVNPEPNKAVAKLHSSGTSQACPDCHCSACPRCPPALDYHTFMTRLGSYKDFCACPNVVCEPHCPEPVLTCHPANLSCPEPVLTTEQANHLKLIQLLRDQTDGLQAAIHNQDNQEILRRFDAWSAESDRRWLACQSKVQHCQPRYSEYDFDQCSLARLPRGERYLVCYDHDAVSGNFTDLPSNIHRLLEALPALQGVTEVFRGTEPNGTQVSRTPDQFPLSPELVLIFTIFAALGLILGFVLVVLLPYTFSLTVRQLRAARSSIAQAFRSFRLPSLPRIIWNTGPDRNLTPPDLNSPPASSMTKSDSSSSGLKKKPKVDPPKSPPPDPPRSPSASAKRTDGRTFKESQLGVKTKGSNQKKDEGNLPGISKDSLVRLTKNSKTEDVVVQIEGEKIKSVKDPVPSSSASSKSSDKDPPSSKGKSTPGQIIKNRSKFSRATTVEDFSSLVKSKDRRLSGPSRGWLRARANEKSRRQQVADILFKR